MITYDYYRIFYYVAQYKSFTKAAAALGNNQPNITRCMNNLEAELDCKLFLRSNKGVLLTPEGHKLYEHVAIAFEQLALGEEAIIRNRDLENGLISIGASENALRLILLSELEHFCARYPHVRIRLLNYSAPQAVKALENNIIDFAIVSTPVLVHKHMHQEKLVSYDEILLGGTKYKQFAQQVHYLEDISEMPLIGLCEGSSTHTHYSRLVGTVAITICAVAIQIGVSRLFRLPTIVYAVSYVPSALFLAAITDLIPDFSLLKLAMITHNLGIGFYPKSLALEAIEKELVFPIELTEPLPNRDVVVITNNHTPINSAARRFLEFLLENRK